MGMLPNPVAELSFVTDPVDGTVYRKQSMSFIGAKSRTKQEFLAETDINNIIKRYRVTGLARQLPHEPMYGDFTNLPNYQESLNIVIRGQEAFARLPSDVRTRYDNDPAVFLAALEDEGEREYLLKQKILVDRPPPAKTLDDVVDVLDKNLKNSSPKPGPAGGASGDSV